MSSGRRIGILTAALLTIGGVSWSQEAVWMDHFGSSGFDIGTGTAIDASGNVAITGAAEEALYPGGWLGGYDAYLRRYSRDGALQWTRQFGTDDSDFGLDVTAHPDGNLFATGFTERRVSPEDPTPSDDVFVQAFDPNGEEMWSLEVGTPGADRGEGVSVDGDGNVYVAGTTDGQFPHETNSGSSDAFLLKLGPSGTIEWVRQFGTIDRDRGMDVDVDGNGDVFVAGFFGFSPSFPNGSGFVRKFAANGSGVWATSFGANGRTGAYGVAADGRGGAVAVGAVFGGLPGFPGAGDDDAFTKAFDAEGNGTWTDQLGTPDLDLALGVDVAQDGVVLVTGITQGPLPGQTSYGGFDAWIRLYDPSGGTLATKQFGGPDSEQANAVATGDDLRFAIVGTVSVSSPSQAARYDAFVVQMSRASCAAVSGGTDVNEDGVLSRPIHQLEGQARLGPQIHTINCSIFAPAGI